MLDYNVPGGKLNRGMAVGDILCHLSKDVSITSLKSREMASTLLLAA